MPQSLTTYMENLPALAQLSAEEIRVLGSLMEKSRTTPEYYPLTLNSLVAACNQKSARKPVVQYEDDTVIHALDTLRKKNLVATATGGSSRTIKYRHTLGVLYSLIPSEIAILALLFLRGPLTVGEINSNSGRLYAFEALSEIQEHLEKLANQSPAFVALLQKKVGQKEARYIHLFSDVELEESSSYEEGDNRPQQAALEERLTKVEQQLATLQDAFNTLYQELNG